MFAANSTFVLLWLLFSLWHGVFGVAIIRLFCCCCSVEMTLNLCILTSILNCHNQDVGEEDEVTKQRLQGGVLVHGVWAGEAIRMVVTTD